MSEINTKYAGSDVLSTKKVFAIWKASDGSRIILSWIEKEKTCLAIYFSSELHNKCNSSSSLFNQSQLFKTMIESVKTRRIIALGGLKKTEFIGKPSVKPGFFPTIFQLTSSKELSEPLQKTVSPLPSPNLLQGSPAVAFTQAGINHVPITCLVSLYQTPFQLQQLSNFVFNNLVLERLLNVADYSENLSWLFSTKDGSKKSFDPQDTYTFGGIYT
ncbi:hypothetical protein DSO57_1016911 [Entomophthora muscae]|uniref:Uncharacterized protein n=1 Tax=Entomophthora muscae TaxID=34485 RepID=A0ACC2U2S4_9FUNG|nr:hypothetical protein DSO57_1016911 [Entomophthora muscae]